MKRNISLIMVFLFGCATAKMVEYVSFQDAVAKTKSRCHYTLTYGAVGKVAFNDNGKVMPNYSENGEKLLKRGWKILDTSNGVNYWKKCTR